MDIIVPPQNIQNSHPEWFRTNGRNWITWKLNKDDSIPKSGVGLSPYRIWMAGG
tara:strand:+ start:545 stop:706 length:162 start_codon:yes stop_codon:yes gene_type:complete